MTISIFILLLIIVVLFEHISTFYLPNGLIHKGKIFKTEDYPYVMYIQFWTVPKKYFNKCTGTLVKKMFVLTAAHCCHKKNESLIHVYQGSPLVDNPKIHKVVKMIQHPDYNPEKYALGPRGDLCVLQLEKAFPNIKTFSKIGGSPKDFKKKKLICTMIGFGKTGDNKTTGDSGYIMTNAVRFGETACELHNTEEIQHSWEQYLCLEPNGYSTPCEGDSGGPMICKGMQYGVCSFGFPYTGDPKGCGLPNQQEIYSFIYAHKEWLNNIIEPKKKKKKKKKKRSSGNLLEPYPTLHIILLILLYNIMLTFI